MSLDRIVVTGANGFIGQHVCRQLLDSGKEVTACIRERADASALQRLSGPLRICRMPPVGLQGDLSAILRNTQAVIHLAARVHVMRDTSEDPLLEFRKVNVDGTGKLASTAVDCGVRRFIYVSSIGVNGNATGECPFLADDPPNWHNSYSKSKWEAEEHLRQIAIGTTMEWVVVRPPMVYGAGVPGNFRELMREICQGIPLPLGSIDNSRTLLSAYNLSDLLCVLTDHPKAGNNCFLAGDSENISTPDLVRRLAKALHRSARIFRCPQSLLFRAGALFQRKADMQRLCSSLVLDRSKTAQTLGWHAPVDLDSGLNRTAEWFLNDRRNAAM